MNQSIAALIAIATVIPLAMIATLNTDKPSAPIVTAEDDDNNNNSVPLLTIR
jgi:hypothetical protein